MSTALPAILRASGRYGLRALCAGVLTIGLLATAPVGDARAATAHPDRQHAGTHHRSHRQAGTSARKVGRAMAVAVAQKGDRYAYGAAGPARFDCSGLTFYSFRKAGFKRIPRTSSAQAHFVKRIKRSSMRRGDLVFFTGGGGVHHVGLFAGVSHGRRQVLHSPYSGTRVRTERMWTDRWFPGTLRYR